jgi:AhpD family alkylhydroperoxidase
VLEVYRLALHPDVHSAVPIVPIVPIASEGAMRIDYKRQPSVARAMAALSTAVREAALEPRLVELVDVRASQLNGCGHCIELHVRRARALGESDDRLHLVAAWREAPGFTERERAALRWTEELTLLADREVPDELYEDTRRVFSEDELCSLTLAIVAINGWNRFAVAFRAPVGEYPTPPVSAG